MSALLAKLGVQSVAYIVAALFAAGFVAVVVGWVHHLESQAAQVPVLAAQLDQAAAVNSDNQKALLALQADRDRQAQIAAAARKSAAATATKIAAIERSVTDAKPSEDASLAPVLRAAIDQLRELAAPPTRPN